jgi:heme oxygenase
MAIFMKYSDKLTVEEYLKHVGSVQHYRKAVHDMWRSSNLDHIISPGFGCQAALHGITQDIPTAAIYTIIWNVLGYASGSLPITVVGAD